MCMSQTFVWCCIAGEVIDQITGLSCLRGDSSNLKFSSSFKRCIYWQQSTKRVRNVCLCTYMDKPCLSQVFITLGHAENIWPSLAVFLLLWGNNTDHVEMSFMLSLAQHFDESTCINFRERCHMSHCSNEILLWSLNLGENCLAPLTLHIKWAPCILYSHSCTLKSASKSQISFD